MNLLAVICVRMSSRRLPGKALCVYDPSGKTNLECIIDRVKTSRHNPKIVVATSTDHADDPIFNLASKLVIGRCRGSLDNVVSRFDLAVVSQLGLVTEASTDYVWRVMADNPLVDVGLVDWRLDVLQRNKADVIMPILPEPTYAAQANIWSREAWDHCAKISTGSLLEHPGEAIYENLHEFRVITECGPESVYYQPIRTELDTPEDLEFFKRVWREYPGPRYPNGHMDTDYVLQWLSTASDIVALNAHIEEKTHTTYLHGHHRARKFKCENEECGYTIAEKVNERLDVKCPRCGTTRSFYP